MSLAMLALAGCLVLASCNENEPPSTDSRSAAATHITPAAAAPRQMAREAAQRPGRPGQPAASGPGQSAQWTLYCQTVRGPAHVQEANRLKSALMMNPQLPNWYLVHNEDESIVCYGYYNEVTDAVAKADKKRIDGLTGINGEPLFNGVVFQPIGSPDPDSPPEWNLANVPDSQYWSLQIAAFHGFPERKKYAVEAVREARAQGVQAYYFHGPTISSVCIGTWPIEAVKRQGEDNVARSDDPETPIIVLNDTVPQYLTPSKTDKKGNPVLIIAPRLDIIDPTLKEAIRKYPDHAVNGYVKVTKDVNGMEIRDASLLVQIRDGGAAGKDIYANTKDQVGPSDPDAVRAQHGLNVDDTPTGLGKLRTLGEH